MMIENKPTADDSDAPSDELDNMEAKAGDHSKEEIRAMATKKHKIALAAGCVGVLILAVVVAIAAGLLGKSFQNKLDSNEDSATEAFDFTDVGPDFSNIRLPSESPTIKPTPAPTGKPTSTPSYSPTSQPSKKPTSQPTGNPTANPSSTPSVPPTATPTTSPSTSPTATPTVSAEPTAPTVAPTKAPVTNAPVTPIDETSDTLLTFCVIADVPYFENEKVALPNQIANQMEGCEFLVHLGDIMKGEVGCDIEHYSHVQSTLLISDIPTFIVPGDNEWNDCGSRQEINAAWGLWTDHFMHLENNWDHSLNVMRQPDYQENFYFIRKRVLIIGLNIVGGRVHSEDEWLLRLSSEADWVRSLIQMNVPDNAAGVIIMAHARPNNTHRHFFNPMTAFIQDELQNQVPILYLHGDGHKFVYNPNFYEQNNFLAIQHEGGVRDPILKILADPHLLGPEVYDSFQYDQQLHLD